MKLFKPEDFKDANLVKDAMFCDVLVRCFSAEKAADLANARLAEIAKGWPVVYAYSNDKYHLWFLESDTGGIRRYKARLAFIEEIVKEPCKHERRFILIKGTWSKGFFPESAQCKDCGVELIAEWKEKK